MNLAFLVYHDVLDDKANSYLDEFEIDAYEKWEHVLGKLHGADGHLGTRIFPGHDAVRLIPFDEQEKLNKLIEKIQEHNKDVKKPGDEMRMYLLPLERIV